MRAWKEMMYISKNNVDKQLQEIPMNQSFIQEDISGRIDVKLWGDTPA